MEAATHDISGKLEQIVGQAGAQKRFSDIFQVASLVAELHEWTRATLPTSHLVTVSSLLSRCLEMREEELSLLGIPVDILQDFPNWREGSRDGFCPSQANFQLPVLGAKEDVHLLRMQLSPYGPMLSAALLLLRRLLRTMPEEVCFLVAIEPGGDTNAMFDVICQFGYGAKERVALVELQMTSIFAQDNARGARSLSGEPGLLIPRSFRDDRDRARESLNTQLQTHLSNFPVYRSRMFWEGGNIVNDQTNCFIGADHIGKNMSRLGLAHEEVLQLFTAEFGSEVEFLGELDTASRQPTTYATGQASFHVDLDVCLLGNDSHGESKTALLADPSLALPHLDQVLAVRRLIVDHFYPTDIARQVIHTEFRLYAEERIEKLRNYRKKLEACGYRVISVPDVRIDPQDNLFGTRNLNFIYANCLVGQQSDKRSVFYLPYDIPILDDMAEEAYRSADLEVMRVTKTRRLANTLMLFNGGLRCACSQVY